MTYRVEFEESTPATEFESAQDCLDLAKQLQGSGRLTKLVGAFFYNHLNESLLIVLGGNISFLSYCPSNYGDTGRGSFSSTSSLNPEIDADFWCCGHHGQIPKENAVSIDSSITALEFFLNNGGRSRSVEWIAD